MDYHFHCTFSRNDGDQLIPWVEITGNDWVTANNTCLQPSRIRTPTPTPPLPTPDPICADVWDNIDLVTQSWHPAFNYQRVFTYRNYLVSQRDEISQFSADDEHNKNANYKLIINEDYAAENRVCFGYLTAEEIK